MLFQQNFQKRELNKLSYCVGRSLLAAHRLKNTALEWYSRPAAVHAIT